MNRVAVSLGALGFLLAQVRAHALPVPAPSAPAAAGPIAPAAQSAPAAPKQRGVALGMFAEDVGFSYTPLLAEISSLGATHVSLIVPLYQTHGGSTDLSLHTRLSPSLPALAEAIRAARREGLEVTVFPIIRLASPRTPNEWRGTLAPTNRAAWFRSYGALLTRIAGIAAVTGATRLVIGSELSTLDVDVAPWKPLLERVRGIFPGTLVYSANWDHYQKASLLDLVDEDGVVAYFRLRQAENAPSDVEALSAGWLKLRAELERWRSARGRPLVLTEVGYRSRSGCSLAPWDEAGGGTPDLDEQRRAFEAFRRVWAGAPSLAGAYIWNWYGWGGAGSTGYTPRRKPAEIEVRRLLRDL